MLTFLYYPFGADCELIIHVNILVLSRQVVAGEGLLQETPVDFLVNGVVIEVLRVFEK